MYFSTADPLLSEDADSQEDVYDARVDGGFATETPSTPCAGEGCRGDTGAQPVSGAPASSTFSGAGNLVSPPPVKVAKPKKTSKKTKRKRSRKTAKHKKRSQKPKQHRKQATAKRKGNR